MNHSDNDSKQSAAPESAVHHQTGDDDSKVESEPPWRADVAALPPPRRGTPGRRRTFPIRLHTLLSDVEKSGQMDIISWQPHGRCFIVRKTDEFVEKLLPQYFNQNKWASFQRQLNLYSFERITAGIDRGAYYHPKFVRGEPALCHSIPRTKVKGTRIRQPADPTNEPNFYTQPNPFQPQLGLAGLEQLLYPSLAMQIPSMANNAMLLQQPNASTEAGGASGNALDGALTQSLALANPLQVVNPLVTQALLASQLGLASTPSVPSMPSSSQNVDLLRQLTNAAATLPVTSAASENTNATTGSMEAAQDNNVSSNLTDGGVSKTVAYASVPSQQTNHSDELNHETTLHGSDHIAHESADLAGRLEDDGNASLKLAAIDRKSEKGPDTKDSALDVVDRADAASVVVSDENDGGAKKSGEATNIIHNTLEATGQPATEGNLNRPSDDQDMGKFLKRCFDFE